MSIFVEQKKKGTTSTF